MGIPASTDYMLRFVDMVRKDIRRDMIGPIVVHCRYFFESLLYCLFCNAHLFYTQALLNLYTDSLKLQSTYNHIAAFIHAILIPTQPVFDLTP